MNISRNDSFNREAKLISHSVAQSIADFKNQLKNLTSSQSSIRNESLMQKSTSKLGFLNSQSKHSNLNETSVSLYNKNKLPNQDSTKAQVGNEGLDSSDINASGLQAKNKSMFTSLNISKDNIKSPNNIPLKNRGINYKQINRYGHRLKKQI